MPICSFILPESQLCLESKAEQSVAKVRTYIGRGRHRTEKCVLGGGVTTQKEVYTYFLNRMIMGGGRNRK